MTFSEFVRWELRIFKLFNFLAEKKVFHILLFIGISLYLIVQTTGNRDSKVEGDAPEYLLTLEALYNHFSPDVRTSDVENLIEKVSEHQHWDYLPRGIFIKEHFLPLTKVEDPLFMGQSMGFFFNENGGLISQHFITYPLLCLPARLILDITGGNPLYAAPLTNALLFIAVLFVILFLLKVKLSYSFFLALMFYYCPWQWYLMWVHPEVFCAVFVVLSFAFFYLKRHRLSLLFIVLAATQYQPLAIAALVIGLLIWMEHKYSIKEGVVLFVIGLLIFLPMLYYKWHFDVTSLVTAEGYLNTGNINWRRFSGFFADPNQGMFIGMPLLILYLILLGHQLSQLRHTFKIKHIALVAAILLTTLVCLTMTNWNHGQSVVNRYVCYIGPLIFGHFILLVVQYRFRYKVLLLLLFSLWQMRSINANGGVSPDSNYVEHTSSAKWLLNNHPSLYNPDPTIFVQRTDKVHDIRHGLPVSVYFKGREIKKMAVHESLFDGNHSAVDSLYATLINKDDLTFDKIYGWAYVNRPQLERYAGGEEALKEFEQEIIINKKINEIKGMPDYMDFIREKAQRESRSIEEQLRLDALYIIDNE